MRAGRPLALCSLVVLVFAWFPSAPSGANPPPVGSLSELAAPDGCVSKTGNSTDCATLASLDGPVGIAASPDGSDIYVASSTSDTLHSFSRDTATPPYGGLVPSACVANAATTGCTVGRALDGAGAVAVSPDGKSVYVASSVSNAIAVFDRDVINGDLVQKAGTLGCFSDDGSGGTCTTATPLVGTRSVAVSPDGQSVYATVGGSGDAIVIFDRDNSQTATNGQLTQKPAPDGCISSFVAAGCTAGVALNGANGVAMSHDGRSVYVSAANDRAIAVFDRDTTATIDHGKLTQKAGTAACVNFNGLAGSCKQVRGLGTSNTEQVTGVAISPNGKSVYGTSSSSSQGFVAVLKRDVSGGPATGTLTQPGGTAACISDNGADGCQNGKALLGASSIVVAPDGRSVYATGFDSNSIVLFNRDPKKGTLKQKSGTGACIQDDSSVIGCAVANALSAPVRIIITPTGQSAYVTTTIDNSVTIFDRRSAFISCASVSPTLAGDAGDNVLTGTAFDDIIVGNTGNDIMSGLEGRDLLCGGAGNDHLSAGEGNDSLNGGSGTDHCDGGGGSDRAKACEHTTSVP